MTSLRASLAGLVETKAVLVCAGPGGVGKTTVAATLAAEAARRGRRACVVTIDPAKRLADALGLEVLTNQARPVGGGWPAPGGLWALMLDTKSTFDDVVTRYASSPAQAEAILANALYRNIAGALSGTQEYMAMEKLYDLRDSGRFDLIVVDTPPSRHALDFLEAPKRLTRFLDNRMFRLVMAPTRAGVRAAGVATQVFLRTVGRVVGGDVVRDAVAFFTAFEGMEAGFRERAARMGTLLSEDQTGFVVVSAPRRDAVEEAGYLARRLGQSGIAVDSLVVNRVFPRFGPVPPRPAGRPELVVLVDNVAQLEATAVREREYIGQLAGLVPAALVVEVPFLADDVHDLAGLAVIGSYLVGPAPP